MSLQSCTDLFEKVFFLGSVYLICLIFGKKEGNVTIIKSQIGKRILVDTIFLSFESMQSLSKIQNVGKRSIFRSLINS